MKYISNEKANVLKPLKWYKKLTTKKGRLEAKAFLVEGHRAIKQIINSHPDEIIEIITTGKLLPDYRNYPTRIITDKQFRSICSTKAPQGTIAVVRQPEEIYTSRLPKNIGSKILLLEDIQDPGNTGTLIRTAAALNFTGVILSEKCADPLSPKCIQSTAGTILSIWSRRTKGYLEIAKKLKKTGYCIVSTDHNGMEDTSILSRNQKLLLALGNEASGISKPILDISNYRLKIPIASKKAESLNVAACGAICMFLAGQKSS